ncbi:MAG TPA: hypothetical protein DD727_01625 [Clostridiales bacterium]|nr:hypothetical protein [Clostridiales bacterium]
MCPVWCMIIVSMMSLSRWEAGAAAMVDFSHARSSQFLYRRDRIPLPRDFPFRSWITQVALGRAHLHTHDCLEINLIISGKGDTYIGNHRFNVRCGDICIFNSTDFHHSFSRAEDALKMLILVFSPSLLGFDDLMAFHTASLEISTSATDDKNPDRRREMGELLLRIHQEGEQGQTCWQDLVRADLARFMALARRHYSSGPHPAENRSSPAEQRLTRGVLEHIQRDYAKPLNIQDLAKKINVSASTLAHVFKKQTGRSPGETLVRTRIQQAMHDLAATQQNILDIALSNGFNSYANFSCLFRKVAGMTPRAFRLQFRDSGLILPPR